MSSVDDHDVAVLANHQQVRIAAHEMFDAGRRRASQEVVVVGVATNAGPILVGTDGILEAREEFKAGLGKPWEWGVIR